MGRITICQPQAVLQRSEAQQILVDDWMGHSNPRHGRQLGEDVAYRQEQVRKVGLGFDLPPSLNWARLAASQV